MEAHGLTLRAAHDEVRRRRPYINPTPGFVCQLARHELATRGAATARFPPAAFPLTVASVYEWRNADGTWSPRTTYTGLDAGH
jgi:hypothetical protein